jgi:hypothetical protein
MTSRLLSRKSSRLSDPRRPWYIGVPTFIAVSIFLLWSVGRLASWVFVVLRANK